MLDISLKFESIGIKTKTMEQLVASIGDIDKKHIPYAVRLAVNRVAELSIPTIKTNMNVVFDRPSPWTLNSLRVKYATSAKPVAVVQHKDISGRGTSASKYLRPNIEGGTRSKKSSEKQWSTKMNQPIWWTPSKNVELDAYGNVPATIIRKLLAATKAEVGGAGKKQQRFKKGALSTGRYFLRKPSDRSGKKPGVYEQTVWGAIRPILFFHVGLTPQYNKTYDMEAIVQRVSDSEYGKQFLIAMEYAISTAK